MADVRSHSPLEDGPPARPEDDEEVIYFEGRPLLRAEQTKAIIMVLLGLALIALPIAAYVLEWGWPWWVGLICVVIAIVIMVVPWMLLRATRYRISNYRIDFERGILKKRIDTLELWHVDDIKFEQGILDRMLNVGTITVLSNDKTTPRLELQGLPKPRELFESLKDRVLKVKRQRGVIKMDMG